MTQTQTSTHIDDALLIFVALVSYDLAGVVQLVLPALEDCFNLRQQLGGVKLDK